MACSRLAQQPDRYLSHLPVIACNCLTGGRVVCSMDFSPLSSSVVLAAYATAPGAPKYARCDCMHRCIFGRILSAFVPIEISDCVRLFAHSHCPLPVVNDHDIVHCPLNCPLTIALSIELSLSLTIALSIAHCQLPISRFSPPDSSRTCFSPQERRQTSTAILAICACGAPLSQRSRRRSSVPPS